MKHRGSCHCGAGAFDVEGEIKSAMACNCSVDLEAIPVTHFDGRSK